MIGFLEFLDYLSFSVRKNKFNGDLIHEWAKSISKGRAGGGCKI